LTRDGGMLRFPGSLGKTAAVFQRGDVLWIVLDGQNAPDPTQLLEGITPIVKTADVHQEADAAVIRLAFKTSLFASVAEDATALSVTLSSDGAAPPNAIALTRQGRGGQTILTTHLDGAERAITLKDPQAGDTLLLIPGRPGAGILTPKIFTELTALPSAAGLVIAPLADDLAAEVKTGEITLARPQGLALASASGATPAPSVQMAASTEGPAFIDFARWGDSDTKDVYTAARNLRSAIARLPESEGNKGRLRLARYLIAHELAAEALGEITIIRESDATLQSDPGLAAMAGAAQYMMGRYKDAQISFSAPGLDSDRHAALWRGLAEAKLGKWPEARHDLAIAQSVMHLYPQNWRETADLARAETGLAMGDLATADQALAALDANPDDHGGQKAHFLSARLLEAQGHTNTAIATYRQVERDADPETSARASYARINAELASGKIKNAAAIEQLEQLRYRWRGDTLELDTLRKLGALYFAENNWREGLETLRIAANYFPDTDQARDAQDDMRKAFTDLFLGGKADGMTPVKALALFYDFIELTPIGSDGDEMIRKLSERLVAVDLLGPAEELLDHQVSNRLEGVAQASVATKLAMIYLLDHKAKDALRVINDTRQTRLPDEVNQQRRILEARSLAALKQYDSAIDLVTDDDSAEAHRLRLDIYWESSNWPVAAQKIEDYLGELWKNPAPLSDEDRAWVMRAAIAYSQAQDQNGLDRLRSHYAALMDGTPDASSFAIVTQKIDTQGVAFRDLAQKIASLDTLKTFMTDFQKAGAQPASTATN
jgi:tetratricopeptide (TPR) repeat protein